MTWLILKVFASIFQLRKNAARSVYGLSVDMIVWCVVGSVCQLAFDLIASMKLAQKQYSNRLQIVQVSNFEIILDALLVTIWVVAALQLYRYRNTMMREVQRLSAITITILCLCALGMTALIVAANTYRVGEWGYGTIMFIDEINWLWLIARFAELAAPVPQLAVNWQLFTTEGIDLRFTLLEALAYILQIVEKYPERKSEGFGLIIYSIQACSWAAFGFQSRIYAKRRTNCPSHELQSLV